MVKEFEHAAPVAWENITLIENQFNTNGLVPMDVTQHGRIILM